MDIPRPLGGPVRQERAMAALIERMRIGGDAWFEGAILVGSLAAGRGDAVSDVDLIVGVRGGSFEAAWRDRHQLHAGGAIVCWDVEPQPEREVAAHKWVTDEFVLVEVLLAGPASGVRLAPPWRVVAGDGALPDRFGRRPPIQRTELGADAHPIERAYDELRAAIRAQAARQPVHRGRSGQA